MFGIIGPTGQKNHRQIFRTMARDAHINYFAQQLSGALAANDGKVILN
jgi:hypothetical protein